MPVMSVVYVCVCVCVHSQMHTYGDRHMNAHQLCGDSSEYGDIFESSQKCPQKLAFNCNHTILLGTSTKSS